MRSPAIFMAGAKRMAKAATIAADVAAGNDTGLPLVGGFCPPPSDLLGLCPSSDVRCSTMHLCPACSAIPPLRLLLARSYARDPLQLTAS